jgi:hypothetical protein
MPFMLRAVVIGVIGGAGLVLTQMYSRRGPLIYPVYAVILAALAFLGVRFTPLPYFALFAAVLLGMLVATAIAFAGVLVLGARQRRELRRSGREIRPGSPPAWGFPLILAAIVGASAAVAFVAS